MVRAHPVVLLLGVSLLLSTYVCADDDRQYRPINPYKETATTRVAVKWKKEPRVVKDYFQDRDINLEWKLELDGGWDVFSAESVDDANAIMELILDDLHGRSGHRKDGYHDMPSLKETISMVYGEAVYTLSAPKPAAVPTECDGSLPNACPAERLWGLNYIKAPAVWSALPGVVNERPTEAVIAIDSGIRTTHEDFEGNLDPSLVIQFAGGDQNTVVDRNGHGTHVAGTIFAGWNNGEDSAVGVVGKAIGGMCGCGVDETGGLAGFCILECLQFATDESVRVINLSYGAKYTTRQRPDSPEYQAYKRFADANGLAIAAAGNEDENILEPGSITYPAAYAADFLGSNPKSVIAVAAIDQAGVLATFSNYGENVRIAAPGVDIVSAGIESDTDTTSKEGTSMAAPHVAGMATLLFNAFPGVSTAKVYDCIVTTAKRPVQPNPAVTKPRPINGGIADLQAAYECMLKAPACPTTGLPPCVDPKSGVPVRTCSTNSFCRQLNEDFICQYKFAADGSLCKNNETDGSGLFLRVMAHQLAQHGLQAKPTPEDVASVMALTKKRGSKQHKHHEETHYGEEQDDESIEDDGYGKSHAGEHTMYGKHHKKEYKSSEDSYGKDKHHKNEDYGEKEYKFEDSYGKDKHHKNKDYGEKNSTDSWDVDYPKKKPTPPPPSLQTCGVCRKGQCVEETREWCRAPRS